MQNQVGSNELVSASIIVMQTLRGISDNIARDRSADKVQTLVNLYDSVWHLDLNWRADKPGPLAQMAMGHDGVLDAAYKHEYRALVLSGIDALAPQPIALANFDHHLMEAEHLWEQGALPTPQPALRLVPAVGGGMAL